MKIKLLLLTVFWLCVTGCATRQYIYSPDELRKALEPRLSPAELNNLEIPFESTAEMTEFANLTIKDEMSIIRQSVRLVESIVSEWKLDITYERMADYTARRVFHDTKMANCLSFTHLFVSLARSAGIRAYYIDVQQDEYMLSDNVVVNSRHVCAGVNDGGDFFLIDFDPEPERSYRMYRKIDDIEALASHYNNIAINQIQKDQEGLAEALSLLDTTLRIKPDFSRALNNRGSILSLAGRPEEAEHSYRKALEFDPKMPEANSNLSGLLFVKGDAESALQHARLAVQSRPGNSQYRLRLARTYLYLGDLTRAFKEFRWVLRRNPEDTQALHGLALTAYQLGKFTVMQESISKAHEINPTTREFKYLKYLIPNEERNQ